MSGALAFSKEVECRRTGDGDREGCHAQFFESTGDPNTKVMVSYGGWLVDKPKAPAKGKAVASTFCHNPVRSYDDQETLQDRRARPRRRHPQESSLSSTGPTSHARHGAASPTGRVCYLLTGQIIGGAAADHGPLGDLRRGDAARHHAGSPSAT